jgi:23S rRNA (cytosine1962-C5)-methyltransferase
MNVIMDRVVFLAEKIRTQGQGSLGSFRVFHGRGRKFPGLEFVTIDYFHPVILITLFSEPPEKWVEELVVESAKILDGCGTTALLQRRYISGAPSEVVWGVLPEMVYAQRGDLKFILHLGRQQNSGFFLDMEPGRRWLEQHAPGKRILNLFAYSCAFSVVAVGAGADRVVNVDMSSAALNLGRANHQINALGKTRYEFLAVDILKSWSRIKKPGPYDLVIIDPPSYQKGSFVAEKDYAKVIRRLPELMPHGGHVLACLNAPELDVDFLKQLFNDHCVEASFIERLQPHEDFPDIEPAQQLKLLIYYLPPQSRQA